MALLNTAGAFQSCLAMSVSDQVGTVQTEVTEIKRRQKYDAGSRQSPWAEMSCVLNSDERVLAFLAL